MIPDGWVELEKDNLGQFRIIQAEQRFRSALRWLADFEGATWAEVRVFLSSYCPPGTEFEAFLIRFHDFEKSGLRPAEVREDGGRWLEDELRVAMASFRRGLDPLSLIGSVISPTDHGDSLTFDVINDSAFMDPFAGSGGFLTITGPPRMGKTGIACLLMEAWLRRNPRAIVLTNVLMAHRIDRVVEVSGVKALSENVNRCVMTGTKWLWVFDDAGLEWIKQRAMSGTSIDLEQFARIVPKHGGSFIYIDQREGGIPTTISEFAESRIRSFRPGFAQVRLPRLKGFIRDIPRPATPYISEARSVFYIDMDIRKMIEMVPKPPTGPEVA